VNDFDALFGEFFEPTHNLRVFQCEAFKRASNDLSFGLRNRLVCVAGAWQFASAPEFAPWVKTLAGEKSRPSRLSQPALETLAIIAYRQPVTRAELEEAPDFQTLADLRSRLRAGGALPAGVSG
jgi:chromosome segregation and condensation protein ScpB